MEYEARSATSEVLSSLVPSLDSFNAFMSVFVPIFFFGLPIVALLIIASNLFGRRARRAIVKFWNRIDWQEPWFGEQVSPASQAGELPSDSPSIPQQETYVPQVTREWFDLATQGVRRAVQGKRDLACSVQGTGEIGSSITIERNGAHRTVVSSLRVTGQAAVVISGGRVREQEISLSTGTARDTAQNTLTRVLREVCT